MVERVVSRSRLERKWDKSWSAKLTVQSQNGHGAGRGSLLVVAGSDVGSEPAGCIFKKSTLLFLSPYPSARETPQPRSNAHRFPLSTTFPTPSYLATKHGSMPFETVRVRAARHCHRSASKGCSLKPRQVSREKRGDGGPCEHHVHF